MIEMTREDCLETVADILELESKELKDEMVLEDIDTWDSIAVLSVISIMNEKYDQYPTARQIHENKTIGDLVTFLGGK